MATLSGPERAAYVADLFGRIAGRYDLLNWLMSAGRHRAWRRMAVEMALGDAASVGRALDIAAGTCDFPLSRRAAAERWVAVDFSAPMLGVGRAKVARARPGADVSLALADACALPFGDGSFPLVTVGFGVRNFADRAAALSEIRRVLPAGGRVAVLDIFSASGSGAAARAFGAAFAAAAPVLGLALAGDRDAYAYLPASAVGFTADGLARDMEAAGMAVVARRRLALGSVEILIAERR